MMRTMRRIDVQDELKGGFEVAPVPPIGPDGGPVLPALRVIQPPRPRLCDAGPCRNYHQLQIQIDAANPRAQMVPVTVPAGTPGTQPVPGGTRYQAPAAFHTETHHYCYPTAGIEITLGSLPVVTCNRWNPVVEGDPERDFGQAKNRAKFWDSPVGESYAQGVAEWERDLEIEMQEAQEAERLIAASMSMTSPQKDPREHR